jgi:Tol biopolymer transport system component
MDVGGGNEEPIVKMPGVAIAPSWSPDGDWILFSYTDDELPAQPDLWRSRPDGSDAGPLAPIVHEMT